MNAVVQQSQSSEKEIYILNVDEPGSGVVLLPGILRLWEEPMLYRIGTVKEIRSLRNKFPLEVIGQLFVCTVILDDAYGEDRDYLQSGGYSLIAETTDDLSGIREIIDLDEHPCEWADRLAGDYLSALYLLNDDFSVVVFMPIAIAPPALRKELED